MSMTPAGKATASVPYLMAHDPDALCAFYEKGFGFEVAERVPDDKGETLHIGMLFQGWRVIMFAREGSNPDNKRIVAPITSGVPSPVSIHIQHPDVDGLAKRAEAAGAKILRPPADQFYGERVVVLSDPEGYSWSFGMPLKS